MTTGRRTILGKRKDKAVKNISKFGRNAMEGAILSSFFIGT
jgi:hypothetical protein